MAEEADRLYRLVEDLLVLSRVERGADLRRMDPVMIHHVLRRTAAAEQQRWPGRPLMLQVPATLPVVVGDEGYVEQIVKDRVTNAVKYCDHGSPIEIEARHSCDEVSVHVLDRGPGFEPSSTDQAFERFYRAPATARQTPGAGIGLYAVRALAEAMNGRVWARSREGGGADVGFALRVMAVDPPEEGSKVA